MHHHVHDRPCLLSLHPVENALQPVVQVLDHHAPCGCVHDLPGATSTTPSGKQKRYILSTMPAWAHASNSDIVDRREGSIAWPFLNFEPKCTSCEPCFKNTWITNQRSEPRACNTRTWFTIMHKSSNTRLLMRSFWA